VAQLNPEEQDYYLDYAEKNNLSSKQLRVFIKEKIQPENKASLPSEESHMEKLYALESHFKVPDNGDPITSLEEGLFFMSMLIKRVHVILYNLVEKENH